MNPSVEAMPAEVAAAGLGKRVFKNTLWLLVGRVGSQGFLLVFTILVARRLGEAGLGQYAFMTSVIYLGNLASTFGTDMLIMRQVAAKQDYAIVRDSLLLQVVLSVLTILVVVLMAPWLPNQTPEAVQALGVYSFSLLPLAFYSVFSANLRAVERMDSFTWLNVLNGILLVGLAFVYVQSSSSILDLAWLLLTVQLICGLAATLLALVQIPQLRKNWIGEQPAFGDLVRVAAPIAILAILGVIYQRAAIYLIATLQGAVATGVFSASLRLVEAAKLGHFALLGALFPAMAQFNAIHDPSQDTVFSKSLKYLLVLALCLAIVFFLFASPIIFWLYGVEFVESASVLKLLAWLLIPVTLTHYYSLMLLSVKQEPAIMRSLLVSLAFLLVFILAGLQRWGLSAVAWGMLTAESVQAAMMLASWRRYKSVKQ